MTITVNPTLLGAKPSPTAVPSAQTRPSLRDPRLDFFRGLTMLVILISHTPENWLALWIPARFGFSDATEIFVFCSGMASAIAFGKVYREKGLGLGSARVAYRIWQVYWAHIGLFLAIAATSVALDQTGAFEINYVELLNLTHFFRDPETQLLGLMTLTYVPNYFDILPMYIVVLALMPLMVALASVSRWAALAMVFGLWIGAQMGVLSFPAEPWTDRGWFFNPFGWQLIFFTGFAWMLGWLPKPPVDRRLVILSAVFAIGAIPLAYYRIIDHVPAIQAWRENWSAPLQKTNFGILRYLHFLSLAYLAYVAVGPAGKRLLPPISTGVAGRIWRVVLAMIMKVGQQSLAVFIASMYLARVLGVAFDIVGRNHLTVLVVNLCGFALLIFCAYGASWFKSQPWRSRDGKPYAAS